MPGLVGILDAEDEGAIVLPREQIVEQRRSRTADMQLAGWTWRVSDAHLIVRQ
jgi:hypothetical protein